MRTLRGAVPPSLDIDARIGKPLSPEDHQERRRVWNLLLHLEQRHFVPHSFHVDGKPATVCIGTLKDVMESLFSCDECTLHFELTPGHPAEFRTVYSAMWIFFEVGNKKDVIGDYSGTVPGFALAVEEFIHENT